MTLNGFGGGFEDGVVVLGRAPVWTLGLPADGVLRLPVASDGANRPFASSKIMWIVGPNETRPVVVRGRERATDAPLWFEVYPSNATPSLPSSYTTTLSLDPAMPNRGYAHNSGGDWAIWGIGVGARTAGCYTMNVSSDQGSWSLVLAVGS